MLFAVLHFFVVGTSMWRSLKCSQISTGAEIFYASSCHSWSINLICVCLSWLILYFLVWVSQQYKTAQRDLDVHIIQSQQRAQWFMDRAFVSGCSTLNWYLNSQQKNVCEDRLLLLLEGGLCHSSARTELLSHANILVMKSMRAKRWSFVLRTPQWSSWADGTD